MIMHMARTIQLKLANHTLHQSILTKTHKPKIFSFRMQTNNLINYKNTPLTDIGIDKMNMTLMGE